MGTPLQLVFTGNSDGAINEIAKLERRFDQLENKIKHAGGVSRQAFDKNNLGGLESALDGATAKFAKMALGAAGISTVMGKLIEQAQEFNAKMDAAWSKNREANAKLQVQDALSDKELRDQMPAIEKAVKATPVLDFAGAKDAQRELSSVGIDERDLKSGEALQTMLDLRAISHSYGDSSEPVQKTAKSLKQFLGATGGGNRAADIGRIGQKVASLSADSSINISDLDQLSQNASTMTQFGVGENEQLAAYRVAYEGQGGAIGGTGLRNMTSRLGTAGSDKGRTAALKEFGLVPADVAIAPGGQTLQGALEKLRAGSKGMDETKKLGALKELFGEESMSTAALMLSDQGFDRYQAGLKATENASGEAERRIATFQASREAKNRRNQLREEIGLVHVAEGEKTWGEQDQEDNADHAERQEKTKTPSGRLFNNWIKATEDWSDYFMKGMGYGPEDAADLPKGSTLKTPAPEGQPQASNGAAGGVPGLEIVRELQKQTEYLATIAKKEPNTRYLNRQVEA